MALLFMLFGKELKITKKNTITLSTKSMKHCFIIFNDKIIISIKYKFDFMYFIIPANYIPTM